jgi:arylsulfatase A-like enzyme/Tfp pilus assembly protein PilF
MRWFRSGLASVLLLTLGCSSLPRFNILLVTIDTCRPDHLACYGYHDIATPNLDRLASEGIIFKNARSSIPLTLPSHVSIMTGYYPNAHGVHDNGAYVVPESLATLAEELQGKGYATAAFIGAFPLDSRFNLDQGFDYYGDYFNYGAYSGNPNSGNIASVTSERPADGVTEEFLQWFKHLGREPFFAWVHYFDPHEPYEAPASYALQYPERQYDAEISFVDHCLGRILDNVEEAGLLERTIVVVTADHGEGLGDHGEDDHGLLAYDSTLKVPLVIRAPEQLGFRGSVVSPVETVDIVPTVLGLVGIDSDRNLDGISLVSVMRGEPASRRVCYFESLMGKLHFGWSELAGVRCGSWKYIHGSKPELYDITTDPTEQNDLLGAFPEVAELLQKELLVFIAPWATDSSALSSTMERETRARLHSLGYLAARDGVKVTTGPFSGPDPREQMASYRWLTSARRMAHESDWARAAAAYQSALEALPANKDAMKGLPVALMMNGEPTRALQEARHAVAVLPSDGEAWLTLSMLLLAQEQPSEARRIAEAALSHGAESVATWMLIGQCAEATGDMIDAERAYRKALAHDAGNLHSSLCLARVLMHTSARSELEHTLKGVADEHPLLAVAQYDYGVVLLKKNKIREARRCFETAIELCPSYSNAHHALAVLLHGEGKDAEALHYLQRAMAHTKNPVQLTEARALAAEIAMN